MSKIDSFRGEYQFLSNFYETPVCVYGIKYPNAEAAFQAQKCVLPEEAEAFKTMSPQMAKRYGRMVQLKPNWEQIKDSVMLTVVRAKFKNPVLKDLLLNTGAAELIEGNRWGDTYWGVCNGKGKNRLGEILMTVRTEIHDELLTRLYKQTVDILSIMTSEQPIGVGQESELVAVLLKTKDVLECDGISYPEDAQTKPHS